MANDMSRAIMRPSYWSRTRAMEQIARTRHADALQHPARDHDLERRRKNADQAADHEQHQAGMDGGLAADTVGERAEQQLAHAHPEKERHDDELNVVRARHAEVAADGRQRRQHRVDRKRDQRHQQADEGHEFGGMEGAPALRSARSAVLRLVAVHLSPATARGSRSAGFNCRPLPYTAIRSRPSDATETAGASLPAWATVAY